MKNQQLSLSLEAGLDQRYRSLVECVASGVYQSGVGRVAALIDTSPSHLSEKLSNQCPDRGRQLSGNEIEAYIKETGDLTPVHYLVAKYCQDASARQKAALDRLPDLVKQLEGVMAVARGG